MSTKPDDPNSSNTSQITPWVLATPNPTPVPSPPSLPPAYESALDKQHRFHSHATTNGHRISPLPTPSSDRQQQNQRSIRFSASFLRQRSSGPLHSLAPSWLPFFSYKDVALYLSPRALKQAGSHEFYDRMYAEWYPTRDRGVFNDGIESGCGGAFFGMPMRWPEGEGEGAGDEMRVGTVREWHAELCSRLREVEPAWEELDEVRRVLKRPDRVGDESKYKPAVPYVPDLKRTFEEMFVVVGEGWREDGIMLVCMDIGIVEKLGLQGKAGLRRVNSDEIGDDKVGEGCVWMGKVEDVMRAVVAQDPARQSGKREWHPIVGEWLGEGINVGVDECFEYS